MAAAGLPGLSPIEVLILHSIRHRGREKKLADICLVLDIEDTLSEVAALLRFMSGAFNQAARSAATL